MSGRGAALAAAYDAASRQQQRQMFLGMNAYDRHKKMVHDLMAYYGAQLPTGGQAGPEKTDFDILRENFRFIRSDEDDAADSWEVRLAKRYYSKLFKEYAIADLSRYKEDKVGLRWRTQREVVAGRGQFVCGATGCEERRGLASFEVPFSYQEAGERRQALVKLRVCPTHAYQLNYRKHREAERAHKKAERRRRRKERRRRDKGGKSDKSSRQRRSGGGGSSTSASDSSSSSSSSSEDDEQEQRSGRKRRRHEAGVEPQQRRQEGPATGGTAPAVGGAAAPAAGTGAAPASSGAAVPAENDFEAFLQGLFE